METAAESKDADVAEELLQYFVDTKNYDGFAAALFSCYDLLRPDAVLEMAWRNKIQDFAFPYYIRVMKEYLAKVDKLEKANEERSAREAKDQESNMVAPAAPLMLTVRS